MRLTEELGCKRYSSVLTAQNRLSRIFGVSELTKRLTVLNNPARDAKA